MHDVRGVPCHRCTCCSSRSSSWRRQRPQPSLLTATSLVRRSHVWSSFWVASLPPLTSNTSRFFGLSSSVDAAAEEQAARAGPRDGRALEALARGPPERRELRHRARRSRGTGRARADPRPRPSTRRRGAARDEADLREVVALAEPDRAGRAARALVPALDRAVGRARANTRSRALGRHVAHALTSAVCSRKTATGAFAPRLTSAARACRRRSSRGSRACRRTWRTRRAPSWPSKSPTRLPARRPARGRPVERVHVQHVAQAARAHDVGVGRNRVHIANMLESVIGCAFRQPFHVSQTSSRPSWPTDDMIAPSAKSRLIALPKWPPSLRAGRAP